jgi:hypothetical protein
MIELRLFTDARVPVRMFDMDDDPVVGIPSASVTGTVYLSDATEASVPIVSGSWDEATSGSFANQGIYSMLIPSGTISIAGFLVYAVSVTGSKTFVGTCNVVAGGDGTFALVGTVTASLNMHLPGLAASASIIRQHHENKREIFTTGSEANREAMYEADGTTIYMTWDLADAAGVPNSAGSFYRKTPTP